MSEGTVIWKGVPSEILCTAHEARLVPGAPNAHSWHRVPLAEATKAIDALRATPCREIEIVAPCIEHTWQERTVRLVPVVVVKARGLVGVISRRKDGGAGVDVLDQRRTWFVEVDREGGALVARAYADDAEVEIVSIDGGPDTVRRVS